MLKEFMENIHKKNVNRVLNKKQAEVDELYASEGLSDRVLEKQAEINRIRHEKDITDKSHVIHETFVQ
jgi:hypothetical protein